MLLLAFWVGCGKNNSVCFAQSAALLLRCYAAALLHCCAATLLRCYAAVALLRCCAATPRRCCALLFAATLLRAPAALLRVSVFLEE